MFNLVVVGDFIRKSGNMVRGDAFKLKRDWDKTRVRYPPLVSTAVYVITPWTLGETIGFQQSMFSVYCVTFHVFDHSKN